MMSLSLGSSSLYLQNKCIPPFFLINSQKSLLKMTQWWPIISISRDVLVWCVPADDLECWAMFALCLSQCPGWLNPSKNLLLVFLRKLINTWPLQWKNEIGQLGKKKKYVYIYIPVEIQTGVKQKRSLDVLASSHCGWLSWLAYLSAITNIPHTDSEDGDYRLPGC